MTLLVSSREKATHYCRSGVVRLAKLAPATGKFFPIFAAVLLLGAPFGFAQTASTAASKTEPAAASPATMNSSNPAAPPTSDPTPPGSKTDANVSRVAAPAASSPSSAAPASTDVSPEAATGQRATKGTGSSLIPHDLSPYGMFMSADVVVKAVMIGLAFASLVTWTLLLAKTVELFAARRRARDGLDALAGSTTLGEAASRLANRDTIIGRLVDAAIDEGQRSQGLGAEGIKERATALLTRIEARAGRTMSRGTALLATIGSTAPFVGLFGTVWGIMNAFIGISKTNTTNLAVVAPGIAEALLATATGLVAAIPAVIIYNMFARGITGYRQILGDASTEVLRLLSRDLDRGVRTPPTRQAAE